MGIFIGQRTDRTSRNPVLITAAALLVLVTMGVALTIHWYIMQRTEVLADELAVAAEEAFEAVTPFTNRDAANLRQFPNRVHVQRAQQLGIPRLANREEAATIKEEAGLVLLENTPHYVVRRMSYSIPYVTEDTARLLDIIGERFQMRLADAGLPPFRYVITSATRTSADQQRLRRVNANAAAVSSHFHGTTVDIHYAAFNYDVSIDSFPDHPGISRPALEESMQYRFEAMTETFQPQLKSILGSVMQEIQRDGLMMVTYERQQPVYHITVNQRIEPVPDAPHETITRADSDEMIMDSAR